MAIHQIYGNADHYVYLVRSNVIPSGSKGKTKKKNYVSTSMYDVTENIRKYSFDSCVYVLWEVKMVILLGKCKCYSFVCLRNFCCNIVEISIVL